MTNCIKTAARLRGLGFNVIPIKEKSKIQDGTSEEIKKWKTNGCTREIRDYHNIGIQYSESSFWALDLDSPELLNEIIVDEEKRKDMMIVKTGRGHHLIFKIVKGDVPPGDVKLFDGTVDGKMTEKKHSENTADKAKYSKEGILLREIDVRVHGYTVAPPSIHPDTGKEYEFVNENVKSPPELGWKNASKFLSEFGFFKTTVSKSIKHAFLGNSGHQYYELIKGSFGVGERRRNLRSLYLQVRIMNWNKLNEEEGQAEAKKKYRIINQTCIPALEEKEVEINVVSAERFFTVEIKPDLENGKLKPKMWEKNEAIDGIKEMEDKHHFISTVTKETWFYKPEDGLYHKHGEDLVRTELDKSGLDKKIKDETVSSLVDSTKIRPDEIDTGDGNENLFDRDYTKIQVRNKVYDIMTNEVLDFSPEFRNTVAFDVTYDKDAKCPRFDEFLNEITGDDERKKTWILEMMAQCLIKKNVVQRGYVLHGKGQNGKGVLLRILGQMLGGNNIATQFMSEFADNAYLGFDFYGKTANIAADGGTEPIEKTGTIKSILGNDRIRCEEKYHNAFSYVPFVTLIFTFNELPTVYDHSDGFNRKIQPINFTKSFYGDADKPEVETIKDNETEMSGILNLLLLVCKGLVSERKLTNPFTVNETKKAWTFANDSFYRFSTEELKIELDAKIEGNVLFNAYVQCCEKWGMEPITQIIFSKKLLGWVGNRGQKHTTRNTAGGAVVMWNNVSLVNAPMENEDKS